MTGKENISPKADENVLTGIRDAYTVFATNEPGTGEMNQIIVKNFLETLAEISLSIAIRNRGESE